MPIRSVGFWLAAGVALVGCSGAAGSDAPDGGKESSPDAGTTKPPQTGSDGGKTSSKADAGSKSDAGSKGDSGTSTVAFALESVTLHNSGRHGNDILFNIKGSDPAAQTSEVHVQVFDKSNNPVTAFDTNWDGAPDSSETRLHFDTSSLGQKSFTQTITLPGLYASVPTIASAEVALSNVDGVLSSSMTVPITLQTIDSMGTKCDPADVTDRCDEGLGCGGTPATCQAGVAPSLTQVAYYGGTAQATEIFVGADPDEDLQSIQVAFLDANGNSLKVDLSGDGSGTPASSDLLDARTATGTKFFFENNPALSFTTMVPKISATPIDSFGHSGTPVIATLGSPVVRTVGQSCDAYGITTCATGMACSPSVVGATNTCGLVASLQTSKCAAAPQSASSGVIAAWGVASGVSLWDPPSGCSLATEVNRPESLVTLKLTQAVNMLTISTAVPETNFDTILYVLPSCATTSAAALACNDDSPGQGVSSTVTMTNVAAGNYVIVVDSGSPQGGQFGLTVTMQ